MDIYFKSGLFSNTSFINLMKSIFLVRVIKFNSPRSKNIFQFSIKINLGKSNVGDASEYEISINGSNLFTTSRSSF